LGLEFVFP